MSRFPFLQTFSLLFLLLAAPPQGVSAAGRGLLGFAAPGRAPEVFAPGVVSGAGLVLHGFPAVSPAGDLVLWPVIERRPGERPRGYIMHARLTGDGWTAPAPFEAADGIMAQAPCFDPDGRLWYQAARPGGAGRVDLWFIERGPAGWGEPGNPGAPPNSAGLDAQPSLTRAGTLYFVSGMEGVGFDRGIFRAERTDSGWTLPEPLPAPVNTAAIDYTPFVDPAERFLLFASSRPGTAERDMRLYLVRRGPGGAREEPIDLSARIGIEAAARFPAVSPDGRFLFYLSGGKIWWVDAAVLDDLLE